MTESNIHKYDDIIDLPHHVSKVHGHMSMKDRAAQFSPFAALTGHADALDETARLTSEKIELSDDEKIILDRRLKAVMSPGGENKAFTFTYFVPDMYKEGGRYNIVKSKVSKINTSKAVIYLENGIKIKLSDLIKIDGDMFNVY